MFRYWKTSLAASYTKDEIEGFLVRSELKDCRVEEGFLNLAIAR